MARIHTIGFELNSATAETNIQSGTATISNTTFRSGAYAMRFNPAAATAFRGHVYRSANTQEKILVRFALYITTAPGVTVGIARFQDSGGKAIKVGLRLTSGSVLELYNFEDSAQVGSSSSALTANTWHVIEVMMDTTTLASTAAEARLNGATFASGTVNLTGAISSFAIGVMANATCDIFFDDWAINDTTGSDQNSWPGDGKVIHLKPNATGDANAWTRGGTDSGTNWGQVDEVTPNGVTDYNQSTTLDQKDLFNVEAPPSLMPSDKISVVQIGCWFAGDLATATPTFKVECLKASGGTITQGAGVTPTSTTYGLNTPAVPRNYQLTLHNDPDGASWNLEKLTTMQIGYKITTDNTNFVRISAVWALVEYIPNSSKLLQLNQAITTSNFF